MLFPDDVNTNNFASTFRLWIAPRTRISSIIKVAVEIPAVIPTLDQGIPWLTFDAYQKNY